MDRPARALAVACYGKLPFHREFLRLGLGSPAAAWVERWLTAAHEAWSKGGAAPPTSPLVRFAAPRPSGEGVVAGVVRQSSDGQRRHPVALFVEDPAPLDAGRWHLVPLALDATWDALAALAGRTWSGADELAAALGAGVPGVALAEAETGYATALARADGAGPWAALTGAVGDEARHLALNLLTIARAQREARSPAEGVSVAVPLGAGGAAASASLWLECLRAATAAATARPVVVLGAEPPRLVAFYRPAEGTDLAAVLSSLAMAPIDDLGERWQQWPPGDAALMAAVERVVARGDDPLAALPGRVRAAAGG
jgi:type VI secretion system ImpM family protein